MNAFRAFNVSPEALDRFAEALSEQEGKQGVVARAAAQAGVSLRQAARLMKCLKALAGKHAK